MGPITIIVTGRPVPWARSGGNGKVRFTPAHVRAWQNDARIMARQEMAGRDPLEGPLRLSVIAVFEVPTSWPEWKRELAYDNRLGHTSKPDADNLVKNAKDAFNRIVYRDDAQVITEIGLKLYGRQPLMKIIIEPLDLLPSTIKRRPGAAGPPAVRLAHTSPRPSADDLPTRNQERRALREAMERFVAGGGKVQACPTAYGTEIQGAQPIGRLPHAREKSEGHWRERKFNFRGGR